MRGESNAISGQSAGSYLGTLIIGGNWTLRSTLLLMDGGTPLLGKSYIELMMNMVNMTTLLWIFIMVTQQITTSHIPTWWESVIMMKGGNMTQSDSHHTHR